MLRLPQEWVARLRPRFDGMSVCVTGGAGFIGGHVVDALLCLGCRIAVIDDLSNSTAEHLAGLIDIEPDRVRFVNGSILDDAALNEAMEGARTVFHLAAVSSVPRSVEDPERSYAVNATGTVRVAEAARRAGAGRIVYSASSSAYGEAASGGGGGGNGNGNGTSGGGGGGDRAKSESDLPAPVSPYASSKLAGEHIMLAWAMSYGLSTVSLRYFNIFGPRQPADSPYSAVIAVFAKRLLAGGEPPVIFGDGGQTRDFTYISNAVLANLLAGSTERPLRGEVVNIGSGERVDLLTVHRQIAAALSCPHIQPAHQPARAGDVRHSLADLARAREVIGYEPVVSMEDGLAETMEWYRSLYSPNRRAASI